MSEQRLTYRGYTIYYDPPPIPDRRFDWHFVHEDYDGEGDPRHGDEPSVDACKRQIDEQLEEALGLRRWWPDVTETVGGN